MIGRAGSVDEKTQVQALDRAQPMTRDTARRFLDGPAAAPR